MVYREFQGMKLSGPGMGSFIFYKKRLTYSVS